MRKQVNLVFLDYYNRYVFTIFSAFGKLQGFPIFLSSVLLILLQFTLDNYALLRFYCLKNHLEMKFNSGQIFFFCFSLSPPPFFHQVIEAAKTEVITGGARFCSFFFFLTQIFFSAICWVIHYKRLVMKRLHVISRFIDYQKMKAEK